MEANITLASLTPEQLKVLKAQLKAQAKANGGNLEARRAIIDRMLQEIEGTGFKHTTADILSALQEAKLVDKELDKHDRSEWLKKIQTRKQDLKKKPEYTGKVGYKASAHGLRLNADTVKDWILENPAKLTPADRKAIIKSLSA
jgi:hypothetical protein